MGTTTDDFGDAAVISRGTHDVAGPHAGADPTGGRSKGDVWRKFVYAQARVGGRLGHAMRQECGLSPSEFSVLCELEAKRGSPVRILDLARDLQWERSRLSHRLSHMAQLGLVSRERDPHDGRATLIAITERGRRAVAAARPGHAALVNHLVFAALSAEQINALAEILDRILDAPREPACP